MSGKEKAIGGTARKAKITAKENDPNLRQRFSYELQKRGSNAGIAQVALSGDREALKNLAAIAICIIEDSPGDREAGEWLCFAFSKIASGIEPNVAFGWTRQKGAPKPSQDFQRLLKNWLIGQHMAGLQSSGTSQREAAKIVGQERHVSPEEAIRCYREWTREN